MFKVLKVSFSFGLFGLCSLFLSSVVLAEESGTSFLEKAAAHWEVLNASNVALPTAAVLPEVGQTGFIPLTLLTRGQDQISIDNMMAKLAEKQTLGDAVWDGVSNRWILAHDEGRSSVPLIDPIQVIKGPMGYVIIDGHHDSFLALYLGGSTVAAEVKENLSGLSTREFWQEMKRRQLVYLPQEASELALNPPKMMQVRDNPNRYLAALIALKVKSNAKGISSIKGSKQPVWVKLNDSVPFIEFHIARALYESGIEYQSEWGVTIPNEVIGKSRQALRHQTETGHYSELDKILILADESIAKNIVKDQAALAELINKAPVRLCRRAYLN